MSLIKQEACEKARSKGNPMWVLDSIYSTMVPEGKMFLEYIAP